MKKILNDLSAVIQKRLIKKNDIFGNELIAILGLTYACQCKCIHCGMSMYPKNKENELKTNEWIDIIDNLAATKVNSVMFFGGEPMLKENLPRLISFAKRKGFKTFLDTNGYLLTKDNVKALKIAGLDMVEISVDNLNHEEHDKLRGKDGVFKKLQGGIKNCLAENINFSISTYATKENIENGELKKIILWANEIGASYIRILPPILSGKWLNSGEFKLTEDDRKNLQQIIDGKFSFLEDKPCSAINKKFIYISPAGDVQPCPYVPLKFGNAKTNSIKIITKHMWNNPIFKKKTKECLMNDNNFRNTYMKCIETTDTLPIDLSQK